MLKIVLFGKLIKKAEKKEPGKGTTWISIEKQKTIGEVIKSLNIALDVVGDIFLDFKPATITDKVTPKNKRLAIFPKENHFPWINIY